ncbi:MAG: hypothetical protein Q4F29_12250 [Lachnospiraceae bacterium]|nr:hypothetical protein [Lachnospiraceae bacterium]
MENGYTENPGNLSEILPFVITDGRAAAAEMLERRKCFFYDACSFRRHANLNPEEAGYLLEYINQQDGTVILTRGILMELASRSGVLNPEYIAYIRSMNHAGITVLVIFEEDLFELMEIAFSTHAAVNRYLCWAVRTLKGPVSAISEMLERNRDVYDEVIKGMRLEQSSIYRHFFAAARAAKVSGDDLGEELLAVCLHVLTQLPGEEDGKFCIITDDKGAAAKIDSLFKKTARQYRGKHIILYSTPKLVQILFREGILTEKAQIEKLLGAGTEGNIAVLGIRIFDLRSRELSMGKEALASLIMQPNGIHIIF